METIDIKITKPIYGTYVGIRDIYLSQALNEKKMLRISIPQGIAVVDPREWMKTAKRMEKVFKIPNKPMILYANYVPLEIETPKEVVNQRQNKLL